MQRALALARRGQGLVEPNPMVGCVLAHGDRVVAEGYHRRFGGAHAEVHALEKAGQAARGATAYVTLEPCSHVGKTGPCCDALIKHGVRRVVTAMQDPFPEVAGRGIRKLRQAGVRVDVGLCRDEAEELNAPYLTLLRQGRPHVVLKWAQSIDGKIATRTGDSRWISGSGSRRMVHRLRARVDAIMVGSGTALADDPLLTARDVPVKRRALRVVVDTRLRLGVRSKLAATAAEYSVVVMTSRRALRERRRQADRLREQGVTVEPCRMKGDHVDLADVLGRLGKRRLTNLLVEGGGMVISELLDRNLADEAYVFVAPRLIGGRGAVSAYAGLGAGRIVDLPVMEDVRTRRIGPDLLMHLRGLQQG